MAYTVQTPIPDEIAKKVLSTAKTVGGNPVKGVHTRIMTEATLILAETMFHYYFMRPQEIFGGGAMIRNLTLMGIRTGLSLISKGCKKAYSGMGERNLRMWSEYMQELVKGEL